jgi:hypothetical protein
MIDESAPSDCFENNGILCGLFSGLKGFFLTFVAVHN